MKKKYNLSFWPVIGVVAALVACLCIGRLTSQPDSTGDTTATGSAPVKIVVQKTTATVELESDIDDTEKHLNKFGLTLKDGVTGGVKGE